ncbi:MAG: alanine:cation symporter family protein [Oscillospiraceae bacterium]|nr:alanine:cation symporter family protein [Oscillospiraceae bacterium]
MPFLDKLSDMIWSLPTVLLIISVGIYYTIYLRIPQVRCFGQMLRTVRKSLSGDGENRFRVLSTALAATVGTGSVAGVATAITLGGAGAVFWLWVSAFLGMAVSFAEGVLSIEYRDGKKGGIMYAIRDGMGEKFLSKLYAFFTVLASFGMGGMVQSNSAAEAINSESGISQVAVGLILALLTATCLFSGRDFTGRASLVMMPILTVIYIFAVTAVIVVNFGELPGVFSEIIRSAFGLKPVAGAAVGVSVKQAVSVGFKRGIFSNEAGLGTTAAIHAGSGLSPREQGLMNMFEVIVDTFVICTLTALAILSSGAVSTGLDGASLVSAACESVFGSASGTVIALCTAGFATATIIGWSKIGLSAAEYLSERSVLLYKIALTMAVFIGAVVSLSAAWKISDIFNGLMVFPCVAALVVLRKSIIRQTSPHTK